MSATAPFLFFVDFQDAAPAYYLCGLLNSTIVKEFVESHNISIQVGDIFKHMNLPPFNLSNPQHVKLSALCKQAHGENTLTKRKVIIDHLHILGDEILMAHIAAHGATKQANKK